jgi:3-oxosteroid 1-dehydrogenase
MQDGRAHLDEGPESWAASFDVVVVGSGAGGMVAALTAAANGLETVIVEKSALFGGSSALSGGALWAPNSPALVREGQREDPADVLAYLDAIAGDCVDGERLARYVEAVPEMMTFLERQSPHLEGAFFWIRDYPDYHPDKKGGNPRGRGIWPRPIDTRSLGDEAKLLRGGSSRIPGAPPGMWVTGSDLYSMNQIRWGTGFEPYRTLVRLLWRSVRYAFGSRMGANGQALMTRLRLATREAGIPLWLESPMTRLVVDREGRVTGLELERAGHAMRVQARHGVILATGGFEWNEAMRHRHDVGASTAWTIGSPDNTGDGIVVGTDLGAGIDLMDAAWWMPMVSLPDRKVLCVAERQFPGQFIVNQAGVRFTNEASPYEDFGRAMLAGEASGVGHMPCFMIIDNVAWKRNLICGHLPGRRMPRSWIRSGLVTRGATMAELAASIDVPPDALQSTADRFNGFVRAGVDSDFGRGENSYERYYGDPTYPNRSLAEVIKPPFYAFKIFLGDLGTKGGLITDDRGRVLRNGDEVIDGLYACGNTSASVMGKDYAGIGATIGPAMTFGWVAACDIARGLESKPES